MRTVNAEFPGGDSAWPPEERNQVFMALHAVLVELAKRMTLDEEGDHALLECNALVREVHLRLGDSAPAATSLAESVAAAARAMRRILIVHARRRIAEAPLLRQRRVQLDERIEQIEGTDGGLLDLDRLHQDLEAMAPDLARIVDLHYFARLSLRESAAVMQTPARTASRQWAAARVALMTAIHRHRPVG